MSAAHGVSTSALCAEAWPERLAYQPVEGLDTNGLSGDWI